MTFAGHVQNGVVVFDAPTALPEGATVRVEALADPASPPGPAAPVGLTLGERYGSVVGSIPDLPSDMAENHDHSIRGTPKP